MSRKHYFWIAANWYGYLFGWVALAPLHKTVTTLSLHALGYDNARHTGEEWFIKNVLAKLDAPVCVDVGANVGAYTKMLVQYANATVYAIEPSASSFKALGQNTAGLRPQVHLSNIALADYVGTATFYSRAELSEKASMLEDSSAQITEEVQVTTLDALVADLGIAKIDFIKVDTEGYELEVFKGMQQTLAIFSPKYVQFEFNHVHLLRNITLKQLAALLDGYQLYRLLPRDFVKIDPSKYLDNVFMFCNIVAVRSDAVK
jgi:FkbM family methyltransferase